MIVVSSARSLDDLPIITGDVVVDRSVYWWPWGQRPTPGSAAVPLDASAVDLAQTGDALSAEPLTIWWESSGGRRLLAAADLQSVDARSGAVALRCAGRLRRWDARVRGPQYPQDVDEGLREQTQPVVIGVCRSVPAVPAIVGLSTYWVADAPLGAIMAVRDRGVTLPPGGDPPPSGQYARVRAGRAIRTGTPALMPLTVDCSGYGAPSAPVGDVLAGYGRWPEPWGGTQPPRWLTGAGATAQMIVDGATRRCLLRIAAPHPIGAITQDTSLTTPLALGSAYRLVLSVRATSAIAIQARTSSGQIVLRRSQAGVHITDFSVDAGPAVQSLVVEIIGGQGAYAVIDEITCTLIDATPPTSVMTPSAEEVMRAIAQRADIEIGHIDAASVPRHHWGVYVGRDAVALDLLALLADSAGAAIIERRDGVLRLVPWDDPAQELPAAYITPDMMLSAPVCELDQARGITIRAGAQRNWVVHSGGDVADSVPASLRAALTSEWRHIVTSTVQLAPIYTRGERASILETMHDDASAARLELDRVLRLYQQPRWMHTMTIDAGLAGYVPELGDVIAVWTGDELSGAWVRMRVCRCRDVIRADGRLACEVTAWA